MNADRWFPILTGYRDMVQRIPWGIIQPHEAQAIKNHGQSLYNLASRGGLNCVEAVAVLTDSEYPLSESYESKQNEEIREIFFRKYDIELVSIVNRSITDAVFTPLD